MCRKKNIIILFILLIVLLVICGTVFKKNDAKSVFRLPLGYISLDEAVASSKETLRYSFWETQISFMNSKDMCIYQTSVGNSEFIVKYKQKYYINEVKYNELVQDKLNH